MPHPDSEHADWGKHITFSASVETGSQNLGGRPGRSLSRGCSHNNWSNSHQHSHQHSYQHSHQHVHKPKAEGADKEAKLRADVKEIFLSSEQQIFHCFHRHQEVLLSEMRSKEASLKSLNKKMAEQWEKHVCVGPAKQHSINSDLSPIYGSDNTQVPEPEINEPKYGSEVGRFSGQSNDSAFIVFSSAETSAEEAQFEREILEDEVSVPRPRSHQITGSGPRSFQALDSQQKIEDPVTDGNHICHTESADSNLWKATLSEDDELRVQATKSTKSALSTTSSEVRKKVIFDSLEKDSASDQASDQGMRSQTPSTVRSSPSAKHRLSLYSTRSETKTLYGAARYELLPLWEDVAQKEDMGESLRLASCRSNKTSARSSGLVLDRKIIQRNSRFTKDTLDKLILSPTSTHRLLWEFIGVMLIVYDVIMLPLQFVFEMPWGGFRRVMRWITGVYWTLDVPSSFFLGFYVDGVLEMRFPKMAKNYLTTWFFPDVSLVALDWIYLISSHSNVATDGAKYVEAGRALRMLRMIRLVRLLKVNLFLNRILEQIHSEHIVILTDVFKLIVFIVIVTHIFACGWYGIGSSSHQGPTWVQGNFRDADDIGYRYSTSLHWALTQFTPASMEVVPENTGERIYNVCVLLCALVTFSSFISSITEAMTNLRKINNQRNQEYMQLRTYLRENRVSKTLSARVWRYLKRTSRMRQKRKGWQDVVIFKDMPETLQSEVKVEVYAPITMACPFFANFNDANQAAMRAICFKATHEMSIIAGQDLFSPGQVASGMFLVIDGVLEYFLPDEQIIDQPPASTMVSKNAWVSEASLWLRWLHPGSMVAKSEAAFLVLDTKLVHGVFTAYVETLWNCYKYARLFLMLAQKQEEALSDLAFELDELTEISHEAFADDDTLLGTESSDSIQLEEMKTMDSRHSFRSGGSFINHLMSKTMSLKSLVSASGRPRFPFGMGGNGNH